MVGCLLMAYGVCIAAYYTSSNRINDGSFFVSYSQFYALVITSGFAGFHLSFAVSLGYFFKWRSGFTLIELAVYFCAQLVGFFFGGLLCWGL